MHTYARKLAFVLAVTLSGLGCNASGLKDGETFRVAFLTAISEKWSSCDGTPIEGLQDLLRVTYEGDLVRRSQKAERVTFDRARASKCLQTIETSSCEAFASLSAQNEDCQLALLGQVTVGGSCYTSFDCSPETYCSQMSGQSRCSGLCTKMAALGGSCFNYLECPATADCVNGRCVDLAAENSSCGGGVFPACAQGLFCDVPPDDGIAETPQVGICHARQTSGPCTASLHCAFPAQCLPDDLTFETGSCREPKREGEACAAGLLECGFPTVANFLTCRGGVCTRLPGEGETCGEIDGENTPCFRSWCYADQPNARQGICQAPFLLGEGCFDDSQCFDGVCDSFDGVCVAQCLPPETKRE